jgi:peptide/nickel transport system substrate-binding protein
MSPRTRVNRRSFLVSAAVGGLGLALEAPGRALAAPARGGTLHVSYPEPTHLNPAIVSGTPTGIPGTQIHAGLILQDDKFQPQPYLADRWSISPDGRVYTFHLVKATFHDGAPVTSADVKFSIEIVKANHPFGVAMHRALEAVDTPDPQTVIFRLSYPYPAFMSALVPLLLPILPKHVYGSGDIKTQPANLKPVGAGPFRFAEWQRGRDLILERHDRFFLPGKPLLDRIIFEYITDPAARMAAVETGAIHLLPYSYVGVGNLKRVESLPFLGITTKGYEAIGALSWIEINLRSKPLSDVRVRRALAHALDKSLIVRDILLGYGKVADGPLVSASPFYNPGLHRYAYSIDTANRLLDEAGYKRGADGTRFKVQLDFIPGTAEGVAVAEYVREQGKKIGVDIQLRNSPDFPTWAGRMGQWEYELSLDAVFNYPDPVIGVERTYISTNIKKSVWANTMGYANPKVDDLFQKAQREQNFDRRKALYGQVQDILTTDLPLIWINEIGYTTVWNKEFDGFPTNVWGTMSPFLDVRWTKAT